MKDVMVGFGENNRNYTYPTKSDIDDKLPTRDLKPHYSDSRFRNIENNGFGHIEQVVFSRRRGETEEKNLSWEYSDRLVQGDRDKSVAAAEIANQKVPVTKDETSPRWYEEYLTAYFGKPIKLQRIVVGIDTGGYDYRVYGFTEK